MAVKATGYVSPIDCAGRVVIPKKVRDPRIALPSAAVQIHVRGDQIILEPYRAPCVICGSTSDEAVEIRRRRVCRQCTALTRLVG
jgi:bifunctional DNA-binding transcriptional regulator/antitoxin component of YhaV-PrlF toxin-antitoxin module